MVSVALFFSAMVVACVSVISLIFRSFGGGALIAFACLFGALCLAGMGLIVPPAGLTALGLLVVCIYLAARGRQPKFLKVAAVGVAVLALAMGGGALMSISIDSPSSL